MKKFIKLIFLVTIIAFSCKPQTMKELKNSGYIEINDSKIYYEVYGKGEPILLIHAGLTDSRMWDYQIDDLSQRFKVIRFDQRGFGKSSVPEKKYNPIKDIITLMDSCQIYKANIVGISLGALQAIDLAIEFPERVKTLIISGASFPDWQLPQDVLEKHIEFTQHVMENGPDSAIKRMLTDSFWSKTLPDKKYKEGRQLFEQILQENKESFNVDWQLRELPIGLVNRLEQISCPTLMFRPENDMPSIIPIADTIAKKISNIKIVEIKDVSHLLNMEKPEEFNKTIIEFIDNN